MSNELKLVSSIPVSVNHYIKPRTFITWKGNTPIANVTMYETVEAKAYKKQFKRYVEEQVKLQGYSSIPNKTQHFYIDCVFYFERTDQDPNNYFKLPLDAITETQLLWLDDNTTCERVKAIYYDSENPRIEITIKPVDYIGIFPTISHLNEFREKCVTCTRSKRNCSILNKAIEGRIQEEISEGVCGKYKEVK
ncbi:MAG: RusA family crossover junction endodeoxyribonuclease [Anaerocolumna sp.]|jgi:Holliday junction resolvase RusA-like endonuclease|nr:RusA family crossover junction endodeoxyribonuclease [Anaerocolumna sp.]